MVLDLVVGDDGCDVGDGEKVKGLVKVEGGDGGSVIFG